MSVISSLCLKTTSGKLIRAGILRGYVALYISDNYWILSRGYKLYKYFPTADKIEYFSKLKDPLNEFVSNFRLTRRLFRAEITHLYKFDEDWFCIARKAIFKYNPGSGIFEVCRVIDKGSRPMNLCQDSNGAIYYGEYFFNPNRLPVNIYRTIDRGKSWEVAYTFGSDEINHIHGLFTDKYTGRLWVFTGDDDKACIAGYTTDGFKNFHREFEGKQEYRICVPLFLKDCIIYPTDSQYTQNVIRILNRNDKTIKDVAKIQGSGIYALQTGRIYAVSTTVEPSSVNKDNYSHLWISSDGFSWCDLLSFEKDHWKMTLFQFGSIRFPLYTSPNDTLIFSGRSIKGIDQSTVVISYKDLQ